MADPNPDEWNRSTPNAGDRSEHWERDLLERLAFAALQEQRRARRWSILFKALFFGYLLALFLAYWQNGLDTSGISKEHTALVSLEGVISQHADASADRVVTSLRDAFEDKKTRGVILRANSPGGSPVQAAYIHDEILRLREKHPDIPLYAVIVDTCASGCYYVAAAAREIYANESSVVGSIGVRMDSFGFVDAMEKLGIERRLLTAGEHKGFLDPFLPVREDEVAHVEGVLNAVHEQFIGRVKKGRGERLDPQAPIFTGLVWTGSQALELGLVDAFGSSSQVAREVIGVERMVNFTKKPDYLERLADRLGMVVVRGLFDWVRGGSGTLQ